MIKTFPFGVKFVPKCTNLAVRDLISAQEVVSVLSEQIGGKGGGRPDFAQGAGETENIKDFVTSIVDSVKSLAK